MTMTGPDYTVSREDVPFTMMVRRAKLIEELFSGEWEQGQSALLQTYSQEYCCIGVACSLLGIEDDDLREESASDYLTFEREYGVSHETSRYLQSMNDGDVYHTPAENRNWKKLVRFTYESRSFEQIARFLEIIWQMTEKDTERGEKKRDARTRDVGK